MGETGQNVLMIEGVGKAGFQRLPLAAPGPDQVLIKPVLSAFKHGTEMTVYTGESPLARRSFNLNLRLFEDRPSTDDYYPRPMGNMIVGEVAEMGRDVAGLEPGQRVYAFAPIADRHVLPAGKARPLGDLTPEQALCIDPASFALGGVLDGAVTADDEVLVTGLGAIGLFAVQYCRLQGAKVFAASHFPARREMAAKFGATVYDPAESGDFARLLKEERGGVDVSIECSGNVGTLHNAIRAVRQCGRAVALGVYPTSDSRLHLGEEFLHNRITLLASLPAFTWNNPVRGDKPMLAGDLQKQVVEDFLARRITAEGFINPVLPFADALEAVELIARSPERILKVALRHERL